MRCMAAVVTTISCQLTVSGLYIECGRAIQNNMDDIKQIALMDEKRKREMGKTEKRETGR